MSRLDRKRIIENQVQEFFPEIQKFEFENEDIFATWLGAQKVSTDGLDMMYPRSREIPG